MEKKQIAPDISFFEQLRRGNFLYVDKTEYIWKLIQSPSAEFFLSRPRRFGKSLTLTTLKAVFEGKKELFEGLAIYDKPYDWKAYPVIHLDMGCCMAKDAAQLEGFLRDTLKEVAWKNGLALEGESVSSAFRMLIGRLSVSQPVVILIDEYDKPILNNVTSEAVGDILSVLKGFYSVIKTCGDSIRFAFITGVSKFCHVSIFSDLNNLQDITMDARFATMNGYTQKELEENFAEWLADVEGRQNLPHEQFMARIKEWYDGFRFEETAETVYNPVSMAKFFIQEGKFSNYWFATGTPSFLLKLIEENGLSLEKVLSKPVDVLAFDTYEVRNLDPLALMLQTGYLTIRSAVELHGSLRYWLDFPNREVSEAFYKYILVDCHDHSRSRMSFFHDELVEAFFDVDLPKIQSLLEIFFAGLPYDVHRKREDNFQNIFLALFRLLDFVVHAEAKTCDGSIDALVEVPDAVYIFEFKLNGNRGAMKQIYEKTYYQAHLATDKRLFLVGFNFSTKTGRISKWQAEEWRK